MIHRFVHKPTPATAVQYLGDATPIINFIESHGTSIDDVSYVHFSDLHVITLNFFNQPEGNAKTALHYGDWLMHRDVKGSPHGIFYYISDAVLREGYDEVR